MIGRTAPDHVTAEELEAELPSAARADEGTLVALAMRAGRADQWASMERLAAKAAEIDKAWAAPPLLLAEAKLHLSVNGAYRPAVGSVVSTTPKSISEAIEFYDKAVNLAESTRAGWLLRQALLERARARDWSGDDEGADEDYHRALQRFPEQQDVLLAYGRRLLGLDRAAEAIPFLRKAAVPADADPEAKHYLAVALRVRKKSADEWTPLAVEAAESGNWLHRLDALDLALDGLAKLDRHDDAQDLIDRLEGAGLAKPLVAAARAIAFRDAGRDEAARATANEAAQLMPDLCSAEHLRFVAEAQLRAGEDPSALSMFERLASTTRQAPDMWRLIRVARKLERWDVILGTAAEWRAAGAYDADLADAELAILEYFAPLEAVERFQDELKRRPDDHALILRRSMLGISLGRPELICRDPDGFPNPAVPDATLGLATVQVLARAELIGDAVRYAYQLLRNHIRDPKTHLAFAWVMHHAGDVPDEFTAPPAVVEVGAAVRIAEGKDRRWIVIEDEPGDGFGDEMSPSAPFVAAMKGKGPGDEFLFAGDELDGRRATVLELANKYAFRVTQVLMDWQLTFGNEPGVEKFDTTGPGEPPDAFPNILPIIRRQYGRKRHVEAVTQFYHEHGAPLWFAANELGAHVADLMSSYAGTDEGIIRCGAPERLEDAIHLASHAGAVVLDITALTTCRFIRILDLLTVVPNLAVTTNTLAELIDHRLESSYRPTGHVATTNRGIGITIQDVDATAHERFVADLDEAIAAIKDRIEVLDCRELAELQPADRDRLSETVGMETAEAILVAKRLGVPLWTDDLFVQLLAKAEFGIESTWTQAVLAALRERESISKDRFAELSAKLIGCGYQPTRFDRETFISACDLADWQASAWPLARLIRHVADPGGLNGDVVGVTASFLFALFDRMVIDSRAEQIATTLLDHLSKLPGGAANVAKVRRFIRLATGIRTSVARHIEEIIRTWLQIRRLE